MNEIRLFHEASPLLTECQPSLPGRSYYDPEWYDSELSKVWGRNWIYVGRENALPTMTMRRISVANQNLILIKDQDGHISSFLNSCRHRGSELCTVAERRLTSSLIACPYHNWTYTIAGELQKTPLASLPPDFDKRDYGLIPVHVTTWNGFIFACLADRPPDFARGIDPQPQVFDNWPMADLIVGDTFHHEIACNWKVFWENYNECLHCPGIHPGLCDLVPVYRKGMMSYDAAPDWTPDKKGPQHGLRPGARTWTKSGNLCGPEFPGLSEDEKSSGYAYATLLPTMFISAHVDYVRAVSLTPLGPERTALRAEWLFPQKTLDAPGFDLEDVVGFARTVMQEDAFACEMNQRGLRNAKFKHGILVPQEYAVAHFQNWLRHELVRDAP
ncbi:MAG: aromatic ring-hydroxylating oxygenase subunit alpha [Hyphomicrobium sp.]